MYSRVLNIRNSSFDNVNDPIGFEAQAEESLNLGRNDGNSDG
jgi:hypothetical protein